MSTIDLRAGLKNRLNRAALGSESRLQAVSAPRRLKAGLPARICRQAPCRLKEVLNAEPFRQLTADNFAVLAEEIAKRVATYQNGSPTTTIGPPVSGDRVLNEFWRDALGGEWVCTAAGTPGTWLQIRPAAVVADPSTGTIPTGYLIWNVTDGAVKRHAGSYCWEITVGADASAKVGFHGVTPVVQAAHIPDPSGGSTVDAEARAAIDAILVALVGKGLLAAS